MIVETLKEFKGMLWGQTINVFTDHKNLMQQALGLTSDSVWWENVGWTNKSGKKLFSSG